jgi:hypothetical protein
MSLCIAESSLGTDRAARTSTVGTAQLVPQGLGQERTERTRIRTPPASSGRVRSTARAWSLPGCSPGCAAQNILQTVQSRPTHIMPGFSGYRPAGAQFITGDLAYARP